MCVAVWGEKSLHPLSHRADGSAAVRVGEEVRAVDGFCLSFSLVVLAAVRLYRPPKGSSLNGLCCGRVESLMML